METLTTTPYKFMWRVKNPENYWADTPKEAKCIIYLNGNKLGKFFGVNRTFDDEMYYINFIDENGCFQSWMIPKDKEIVLEPIH